jgi:hypothetical protein|tara:strand:- start:74 stop:280 length:207 start_codon:yes stop_codon:yes gene_type:complete
VEAVVVVKMKIPHTQELQEKVVLEAEVEELVHLQRIEEQELLEQLTLAVAVAVVEQEPLPRDLIIMDM